VGDTIMAGRFTRLVHRPPLSWLVATFIGGLGIADGGAFAGLQAADAYALPQAVWFMVDILRHWLRSRATIKIASN
jgi:hypothetical protein